MKIAWNIPWTLFVKFAQDPLHAARVPPLAQPLSKRSVCFENLKQRVDCACEY
jgi:hypothetical protein